MQPSVLTSTILTFAAIVGVGALLRAFRVLRAEDAKTLNAVIVYVGLPVFIFQAVRGAELGGDVWRVVAVAWIAFAAAFGIAWVLSRVRAHDPQRRGAFLLAAAFGNTGFIGYPVAAAVLGAAAVPMAVFSDVFGTVFALVLIGLPVAARLGGGNTRVNLVRELLTFPAVIALAAGLIARPLPIPSAVSSGLDLLANLVAPLIMLSVGLALKPRSLVRGAVDVGLVSVVRLALAPMIALLVGDVMLSGQALQVATLQAGMPTMMLTLVVGERFGLDSDFIASAIFTTTVLSAVTIPLIQAVVG
ncbi:MAG: AEC family transporter [Coriobacteriia bacterium]|nr:AEC family transporter [Coriobacteriia bacterium]